MQWRINDNFNFCCLRNTFYISIAIFSLIYNEKITKSLARISWAFRFDLRFTTSFKMSQVLFQCGFTVSGNHREGPGTGSCTGIVADLDNAMLVAGFLGGILLVQGQKMQYLRVARNSYMADNLGQPLVGTHQGDWGKVPTVSGNREHFAGDTVKCKAVVVHCRD